MRIHAFHPSQRSDSKPTEKHHNSFREILESVGRYEKNAELALRQASSGEAQFEDLLALQVEVQMWSRSNDLFSRVAGQVSRSIEELARSTQ